jgi:hypothetical protein
MRHPQPSEIDNLEPLEIQEPLYHHRTESQHTGSPGPVKDTPTHPTHPLEPKKPTPIHFLERTEKLSIIYRPKDGMPFTKEEYARKDLQFLVRSTIDKGGIKNLEELRLFRIQFEAITHYLIRNGHNLHMDEFSDYLWRSLSPKLEILISDPLIWDGHLVLDGNFHIAEIPPYTVILEYIDMEFKKMDSLQEAPDQPAQEIGQNNQNQFPQRPMEYFNSEIQLPLTENFPPVLSSTLDACPLNLEYFPQLLENSLQLEPLDKIEAENLGSESEICAGNIFSEEDLPVGILVQTTSTPIPELKNSLTILLEDKNEEKFSQNIKPEDVSVLDSVHSYQSPTMDPTVSLPEGIGTPDKTSSEIQETLFSEIHSHLNLNSLDSHGNQLLSLNNTEQMTSPTGSLDKGIFQKDPGKTKETLFLLATVMKNPLECLSLPTHQVTQHQKLEPSPPPDISQIPLKPSLASPENVGKRRSVDFIKQRIKPTSIKDQINSLQFFLGWNTTCKKQTELEGFGTQLKTIDVGVNSIALSALNELDQNFNKEEIQRSISYRIILPIKRSGYTPSIHSEVIRICTADVEATFFASLSCACLVWYASRKRKKTSISNCSRWMVQRSKKRKGLILQTYMLKSLDFSWTFTRNTRAAVVLYRFKDQQKIIRIKPSISSGYVPSPRVFMKLPGPKGFEAIGFELLHLDCSRKNIVKKDYWTIAVEATCFAFLNPDCLIQNLDPIKKGRLSDHLLEWKKNQGKQSNEHTEVPFWQACRSNIGQKGIKCLAFLKDLKKKTTRERSILLSHRLEENWVSSKSIPTYNPPLATDHSEVLWQAWRNKGSHWIRLLDCFKQKKVHSKSFDPGIGRTVGFINNKISSGFITSENDCSKQLLRGAYCNLTSQQDFHDQKNIKASDTPIGKPLSLLQVKQEVPRLVCMVLNEEAFTMFHRWSLPGIPIR